MHMDGHDHDNEHEHEHEHTEGAAVTLAEYTVPAGADGIPGLGHPDAASGSQNHKAGSPQPSEASNDRAAEVATAAAAVPNAPANGIIHTSDESHNHASASVFNSVLSVFRIPYSPFLNHSEEKPADDMHVGQLDKQVTPPQQSQQAAEALSKEQDEVQTQVDPEESQATEPLVTQDSAQEYQETKQVDGVAEESMAETQYTQADYGQTDEQQTQTEYDPDQSQLEHLPEPPASTSSASPYADMVPKKPRVPSANRLSISYAGSTKRLVIDAEAVNAMKIYRSEGRIEIEVNLIAEESNGIKGITVCVNILLPSKDARPNGTSHW